MSAFDIARDALRDELIALGFARHLDAIIGAARPAAHFVADAKADGAPIGASKVGGFPDVLQDFRWPTWRRTRRAHEPKKPWRERQVHVDDHETPLMFVAQVDLASMQQESLDIDLPREGLLSLFYDADAQPWGFDPIDNGAFSLAPIPSGDLVRMPAPAGAPAAARELPLTPKLILTLPDDFPERLGIDGRGDQDRLFELISRRDQGVQLGGYPQLIQNQMEGECEIVSHGYYAGDLDGPREAERAGIGGDAKSWRLVMQVSTIDEIDLMWGDTGNLYVWMRERDIRNRHTSAAWTILQCS